MGLGYVCSLTLQKIWHFVATFSALYNTMAACALTGTVESNP